ncbi:MAG TPA: hypothetical protein VHS09_04600 [Polyangiaceae bacterium]|nr:hypothetical protein [Polyangiaceae bacterium]
MRAVVAVITGLVLVGCTSTGAAPDDTPDASPDAAADATTDATYGCLVCGDATEELPDWVRVEGEIDRVCSSADNCHGSGAGGMGLSPGHEFGTLIDVVSTENPPMKRVSPGDPANSYVYLKLACEGGIEGACMPFEGAKDPALARLFHDWIESGAPTQ